MRQIDGYRCPQGQILHYRTTNRSSYREYASDPKQCQHCAVRERCTQSQTSQKVVVRHVWEEAKELMDKNRLTPEGKQVYR